MIFLLGVTPPSWLLSGSLLGCMRETELLLSDSAADLLITELLVVFAVSRHQSLRCRFDKDC